MTITVKLTAREALAIRQAVQSYEDFGYDPEESDSYIRQTLKALERVEDKLNPNK